MVHSAPSASTFLFDLKPTSSLSELVEKLFGPLFWQNLGGKKQSFWFAFLLQTFALPGRGNLLIHLCSLPFYVEGRTLSRSPTRRDRHWISASRQLKVYHQSEFKGNFSTSLIKHPPLRKTEVSSHFPIVSYHTLEINCCHIGYFRKIMFWKAQDLLPGGVLFNFWSVSYDFWRIYFSPDLEVNLALGVISIDLPLLCLETNTLIWPNMYDLRKSNKRTSLSSETSHKLWIVSPVTLEGWRRMSLSLSLWFKYLIGKGTISLPEDLEISQEGRRYLHKCKCK